MVWIQLLDISGSFYEKCLLEAVGNSIGQMIKVDNQTENRMGGQFARMAVSVDHNRPLISKVRVEGKLQRVEYEGLPNFCFGCGLYGHQKEICPKLRQEESDGNQWKRTLI